MPDEERHRVNIRGKTWVDAEGLQGCDVLDFAIDFGSMGSSIALRR
jgi:hypothetical protein